MAIDVAIVVTSVTPPTAAMRLLARGCAENGHGFFVIGDAASPPEFQLAGCGFYDLEAQYATGLKVAELCPTAHYARKNVGYLMAARQGAKLIIETDDDNIPYETFWAHRERRQSVPTLTNAGWVNVYRYFSKANMWPRGLPLDRVKDEPPEFESLNVQDVCCPIQQGLSDENPDVDAIYRLIHGQRQYFRNDRRVALAHGTWCPFNSQNTRWWSEAFPLLYLPAYCAARMTDIWRSFVAQRIAWTNGWSVLFHEPTVRHERNQHDLVRDFRDEVPGYLHNAEICSALESLSLPTGVHSLNDNLRTCYEKLVRMGWLGREELPLLEAWISDLTRSA